MFLLDYLTEIGLLALLDAILIVVVIPWVLLTKRDSTVAVAWCLVVLFMPVFGALLFWVFGYNYLHRRVRRKQRHLQNFSAHHPPPRPEATRGAPYDLPPAARHPLAQLAQAVEAFPVTGGNAVTLYHETEQALEAMLEAITSARHHIHLEFFIYRSDATGRRVASALTERARAGVQVRLLLDAAGCIFLDTRIFRALTAAGGKVGTFLPVNPLRSWIQVNLRNHRKIVVVDGQTGFTGGMNIGDEYLGRSRRFGYWRDTFLRLRGPAVAGLQRIFTEDWDFAEGEALNDPVYFAAEGVTDDAVQVVESGPDQTTNSIREIFFAAILNARRRLWIASPYFVPDSGILDALRLARYRGVDVRLLCLLHPDHYLSFYAGRYYWSDLLRFGARVYQYGRGMMHAKVLLVDGRWAMVGSANLDNRSLHLNFEAGCMLYTPALVQDLEARFLLDLEDSVELDRVTFAKRSFFLRLIENACRLFSPVL